MKKITINYIYNYIEPFSILYVNIIKIILDEKYLN